MFNLYRVCVCARADAAFKILNPKAVPKFFRLNSHNAILEFLLEVVFVYFSPPQHVYLFISPPIKPCLTPLSAVR